jgi:hypothetical protein
MKTLFRKMALVLSMICIIGFASPIGLYADNLDDLSKSSSTNNNSSSSNSSNDSAISDYLQDYNPVTSENMQSASTYASPIVSFLGTLSGFIVMIASAGIFVVTALDLCYIGLPFTRSILNPQYQAGGQAGGSPMGMGGGMGMGMRGGMGMGMQGGMGGGAQGGGAEYGLHRRWVSDEAVACVQNNMPQAQAGGMPMGGGMGMGGGMMGGGMMGGGMQQQQPQPTKSVIMEYLKKRSFFLIVFAIATVILMSSIFTNCGLNLAELITKIVQKFNTTVGQVNI